MYVQIFWVLLVFVVLLEKLHNGSSKGGMPYKESNGRGYELYACTSLHNDMSTSLAIFNVNHLTKTKKKKSIGI